MTIIANGRRGRQIEARLSRLIPFVVQVNPQAHELGVCLMSWLREIPLGDPVRAAKIEEAGYYRLIASVYPTARPSELVLIARIIIWMFLYDDRFDVDQLGGSPEPVRKAADGVGRVLRGARVPEGDSLLSALADLRDQAAVAVKPDLLQRLETDILRFARSVVREVETRIQGETPSLEEYLSLRLDTFAWDVLVDLIEVAQQTVLPDVIRQSAEYRSLLQASGRLMSWINDLYSLPKELAAGELHNLVLVLRRRKRCTVDEAEDAAIEMVGQEIQHFLHGRAAVTRIAAECLPLASARDMVERCAANLEHLISGENAWCASTSRYRCSTGCLGSPA